MCGTQAAKNRTGVGASVGKQIRHLRRTRGLTQLGLAYESRLSLEHIGKVERGNVSPSVRVLCQIADGLSVPVARLLEPADVECAPLADLVRYLQDKPPRDVAHALVLIRQILDR